MTKPKLNFSVRFAQLLTQWSEHDLQKLLDELSPHFDIDEVPENLTLNKKEKK